MIWSCEVDYSGYDDDIHHHHFFLEQDDKPTEAEVALHYNKKYYNPNDWEHKYRIMAKDDGDWGAYDEYDMKEKYDSPSYIVYITIEPLKVERLEK